MSVTSIFPNELKFSRKNCHFQLVKLSIVGVEQCGAVLSRELLAVHTIVQWALWLHGIVKWIWFGVCAYAFLSLFSLFDSYFVMFVSVCRRSVPLCRLMLNRMRDVSEIVDWKTNWVAQCVFSLNTKALHTHSPSNAKRIQSHRLQSQLELLLERKWVCFVGKWLVSIFIEKLHFRTETVKGWRALLVQQEIASGSFESRWTSSMWSHWNGKEQNSIQYSYNSML